MSEDITTRPVPVVDATYAPEEEALDEDFLPPPRKRADRLTVFLVAGLIAVAGFGGGVWWDKRDGGTTAGFPAAGQMGQMGQMPGGMGEGGGFPGGGTASGGAGQGGSTTSAASTSPVAVGTVVAVDGTTLTLKNLGGDTVEITVPEGTSVVQSSALPLGDLTAGTTVSVTGTKADDGSVTASGVTAR